MEPPRAFGFSAVGLCVQTSSGPWIVRWIDPGRSISDETMWAIGSRLCAPFHPPACNYRAPPRAFSSFHTQTYKIQHVRGGTLAAYLPSLSLLSRLSLPCLSRAA